MATPTFCCGWECGIFGPHWTATGAATFDTTTVRSGARSLRCNAAGAAAYATIPTSGAIIVDRFYVRFATLPSANAYVHVNHALTANAYVGLYYQLSDTKLYGLADINISSTGFTPVTGVWYQIDLRTDVSANPWTVDVQINGAALPQVTRALAADTYDITYFGFTSAMTADAYYDDYLTSATSADYPLGTGYVNHFVPTADGTHNVAGANDFERSLLGTDITNSTTDAYLLVDEIPLDTGTPTDFINLVAPPNATDYVEVIFGPAPAVSTPVQGPRAVEVIVVSAAATTGPNNLRLALNDNGSLSDVINASVGSTTCVYGTVQYADPPSAATAWGVASGNGNFNDVRMRCYTNDAVPDPYFVGAMIEAEFIAPVLPKPGMDTLMQNVSTLLSW